MKYRFACLLKSKKTSMFYANLRHIFTSFLLAPKTLIKSEASREACSLSYYGLFCCIPILVFFLRLSQHLFTNLNWQEWLLIAFPDYKEPILAVIEAAYSTKSNIGLVLISSFFVFCWSGILMLISLEDGLNRIFLTNSYLFVSWRRLISYFIITLVSPMVFIIICGAWIYITQIMPIAYPKVFATSYAMNIIYCLSRMLPYFFLYVILFCCYAFLPRIHVKKTSALIASLITGVTWVIFQQIFFSLQIHLFNYSFTYGALVALPSFLLLLYLCAITYLFGGALTFLIQNQGCLPNDRAEGYFSKFYIELLSCIYTLTIVSKLFNNGEKSSIIQLSQTSKIGISEITQSLVILEKEGLVHSYQGNFKPSFQISDLTIQDVLTKLLHIKLFEQLSHPPLMNHIQKKLVKMFGVSKHSILNETVEALTRRLK